MPEKSMGISFGQSFRCGVFALAKVSNDLQKRICGHFFTIKFCKIPYLDVMAIQRLAVAGFS